MANLDSSNYLVQERPEGRLLELEYEVEKSRKALNDISIAYTKKGDENNALQITIKELQKENEVLHEKIKELTGKDEFLEGEIKGLTDQLKEAKNTIEKLQNVPEQPTEQLKKAKDTIQELQNMLKQVCDNNCVLRCLVYICQEKLHVKRLCDRYLEKMITKYATENSKIEKNDLRCDALMKMLKKSKIVDKFCEDVDMRINREETTNIAWDTLRYAKPKNGVLMIGMVIKDKSIGHCVVFDSNKNSESENGLLQYYEAQIGKWIEGMQKDFRCLVANHDGMKFFTVNLGLLKDIIDENMDILHLPNSGGPQIMALDNETD